MSDIMKKVLAIVGSLLLIAIAFVAVYSLFVWLGVEFDSGNIFALIAIAIVIGIFSRFLRVE